MRKDEYLNILSDRLRVLPTEEYNDIMEYYKEYFEEAGEDNEADVVRELGDVEELAKRIIKENLGDEFVSGKNASNSYVTNSEYVYEQKGQPYISYQQPSKGLSTGWKVAIAILTFPIWIGLVCGAAGILFGFGVGAVVCFVAGIATIIAGFATLGVSGATCLLFVGGGLLVIAVSLGLLMASVGMAQLLGKICKAVFGRKTSQNI